MNEVCSLIKKSMTEKIRKLSKLTAPKILLLYDNYGFRSEVFSQENDAENCTSLLKQHLPAFHTIFWVYDKDKGFVLHSEEFRK